MSAIDQLLAEKAVIVGDGGMGTQLFERGLTAGDPPEMWNIDHAEAVREIHAAYMAAEADGPVTMEIMLAAARFEYAKRGYTLPEDAIRGWV